MAVARRRCQPSIVGFNDRSTNGEPHPHAVRLGGEKRVENTIDIFRRDTGAGILDGDRRAGCPVGDREDIKVYPDKLSVLTPQPFDDLKMLPFALLQFFIKRFVEFTFSGDADVERR